MGLDTRRVTRHVSPHFCWGCEVRYDSLDTPTRNNGVALVGPGLWSQRGANSPRFMLRNAAHRSPASVVRGKGDYRVGAISRNRECSLPGVSSNGSRQLDFQHEGMSVAGPRWFIRIATGLLSSSRSPSSLRSLSKPHRRRSPTWSPRTPVQDLGIYKRAPVRDVSIHIGRDNDEDLPRRALRP